MNRPNNPFICESASSLEPEFIYDIFIENHNYSRLLLSKRNFFIQGERGSGKSMILRYHSLPVQFISNKNLEAIDFVGIYIPCNTPLNYKREHDFLEEHLAMAIAEHYLVLSLAQSLVDTLKYYVKAPKTKSTTEALEYFKYIIADSDIPAQDDILESLSMYIEKISTTSQQYITTKSSESFYADALTFGSFIIPLLKTLRKIEGLTNKHFMFLIDDAHDLNKFQKQIINSYIAYRDHSVFSFKIAVADISRHTRLTAQDSTILEGHDYTLINLEKDFQSKGSSFGQLASDIVERRLDLYLGSAIKADDFFPIHTGLKNDLERCKEEAKQQALDRYNSSEKKKISDYVYKYARALYFRNRDPKASLPIYSGFNTISHVSTGVIRKLLEPCFKMYDEALSKSQKPITFIEPNIQQSILLSMSDTLWNEVKDGYCDVIKGCTKKDSEMLYNFFDKLGLLFRDRLLHDRSEPRVLVFTVSSPIPEYDSIIDKVFTIARKAQLLYYRAGPSKDDGIRETYYVPNRLLWISRGLDPEGQHGRIPLKTIDIFNAMNGTKFPYAFDENSIAERGSLFDVR